MTKGKGELILGVRETNRTRRVREESPKQRHR